MKINHKKCGIIYFRWRKKRKSYKEFKKFPLIDKYKYLGAELSSNLTTDDHLNYIEKKITFITYKLTPIRMI
jgi:hypothetical protein